MMRLISVLVFLVLCLVGGVVWYRRGGGVSGRGRFLTLLLPSAGGLLLSYVAFLVYFSDEFFWNQARLVASAAFVRGFEVYTPPHLGGVGISGLNGPSFVLAYSLPAWVSAKPDVMIRLASLTSVLLVLCPVAWLFSRLNRDDRKPLRAVGAFLLFGLSCLAFEPTLLSVHIVHADAPALGTAALAIILLYLRARGTIRAPLFLIAFLLAFSVTSKIVTLPLIVLTVLWLGLLESKRELYRFGAALAGCTVAMVVLYIALFGEGVIFHNLIRPFSYGWKGEAHDSLHAGNLGALLHSAARSTHELLSGHWLLFVLVLGGAAARAWSGQNGKAIAFLRSSRGASLLFVASALILLPSSILAHAKAGGAANTFSPTILFCLLALAVGTYEGSVDAGISGGENREEPFLPVLLILLMARLSPELYSVSRAGFPSGKSDVMLAYDKLVSEPNRYFFPDFPLSSLLAEGKLYHSWAYISEHVGRRFEISKEAFRAYIPDSPSKVVFRYPDTRVIRLYFPNYRRAASEPSFEGWTVMTGAGGHSRVDADAASL